MANPKMLQKHLDEVVNVSWNFANRLRDKQDHILNAAIGLAAEAGEVLDEHKKAFFHTPKDRRDRIIDEVGDVYFYLLKLQELWNFTTEEALEANRKKLMARHEDKFTSVVTK